LENGVNIRYHGLLVRSNFVPLEMQNTNGMKTTMSPLRPLILALAFGMSAFAAKAQDNTSLWQADNQYASTFKAMSQGQTPASFVHSQAADAEAVYHFGRLALAFVMDYEEDDAGDWSTFLQTAVIESGHVHFMPCGKSVETPAYSYCDYDGHIGNERFGMRQYLHHDGAGTRLVRILYKVDAPKQGLFTAAEVQLLGEEYPLASR